MREIAMLARLDPLGALVFAFLLLVALPMIVIGAAGAFFPDEADELEEETA